jgi:hypothetical protein
MAIYSNTHRETYIHFVDSVLRGTLGNFLLDSINDPRLRERTKVTKLITFAVNNLTHNTAHDLNGVLNSLLIARMKQRTLPERVLGRSPTRITFFGAAKGPITLRT